MHYIFDNEAENKI